MQVSRAVNAQGTEAVEKDLGRESGRKRAPAGLASKVLHLEGHSIKVATGLGVELHRAVRDRPVRLARKCGLVEDAQMMVRTMLTKIDALGTPAASSARRSSCTTTRCTSSATPMTTARKAILPTSTDVSIFPRKSSITPPDVEAERFVRGNDTLRRPTRRRGRARGSRPARGRHNTCGRKRYAHRAKRSPLGRFSRSYDGLTVSRQRDEAIMAWGCGPFWHELTVGGSFLRVPKVQTGLRFVEVLVSNLALERNHIKNLAQTATNRQFVLSGIPRLPYRG